MSVISRFTKNIKILDYRGQIHFGRVQYKLSQIGAYFRNNKRKRIHGCPRSIKRVIITDHALQRWNERVGPTTQMKVLEETVNALFFQIFCVELVTNDTGVIDNDILFTYYRDNDSIIITTFYGRKSLNFTLNRMEQLRNFNKYKSDKIDLSISVAILQSQILPPIPCETMLFKGSMTTYYIEKYMDEGSSILFIHVLAGENHGQVIEIDVSLTPIKKLSKSILRALYHMGYVEYVYHLIQHFKGGQLHQHLKKNQFHKSA